MGPRERWYTRYYNSLKKNVGALVTAVGVLLIVAAYFLSHGKKTDELSEYLKDAGFHLAAAGFVLVVIEPKLHRASRALMKASIQNAVFRGIERVNVPRLVRKSLVGDEEMVGIRAAVTKRATEEVLTRHFEDWKEGDYGILDSILTIIHKLHEMRLHESWATNVFNTYLSDVIRGVSQNTKTLTELCSEKSPTVDPHSITFHSPARRVDQILTDLMRALPAGSSYIVISDLKSWKNGKLNQFFKDTLSAAARGVKIRRLFVVGPKEFDGSTTAEEAHEILRAHVLAAKKAAKTGRGYRVRLLDDSRTSSHRSSTVKQRISSKHYGVFIHKNERLAVKVTVDESDLSRLYFSNVYLNSDEISLFEDAWAAQETDLDIPLLKQVCQSWPSRQSNA